MRAVLVKNDKGPAKNLHIGEVPKPALKEGEILVKVIAFGLNRMDILQREGKYPLSPGASTILGVEFSGTVAEVGKGGETSKWKGGEEVFGLAYGGAYAEYIAVAATMVVPKPDYLSHVQAAAICENWLTAFQALILIGELKKGQNVLIHAGASGVGIAGNQLARFFGAKEVFTTAGSDEKVKYLENMNSAATHAFNYNTQDFAEEIAKITDGKGVDLIVDFIGKNYWTNNISTLARDGRLVFLGLMSGSEVEKADLGPILFKRLRLEGSTLRSRSLEYQSSLLQRFRDEALAHVGVVGGFELKIHEVYPWTKIVEAHQAMEANANTGKIVVTIEN